MDNDTMEAAPVITATVHSFAPMQVVEVRVDGGEPHWVPVLGLVSADEAKAEAIGRVQERGMPVAAPASPSLDADKLMADFDAMKARLAELEEVVSALKSGPMVADVASPHGMVGSATGAATAPAPATDEAAAEGAQTGDQSGTTEQAGA